MLLYAVIGVLSAALLFCVIKLIVIKKSAREISAGLKEKLSDDTNTLIDISSADKDMRELAVTVNEKLLQLRKAYLRYHQGDTELKNALTNISHDLRTPLTTICGYLDLLKKTDDPQKQKQYLEIIRERADLMKQLTEELFRYSMIVSDSEELTTESVYINQLLTESVSSFYPALTAKGITPVITISDKRIERNVNKAALSRVFSNLLNNAVKYSDGDLEITLTDSCEISFSNTAKELSAVSVEQLFDRFYTVEAAHNSTGLGLSIAKTLIQKMGGSISADYKDDKLTIAIRL